MTQFAQILWFRSQIVVDEDGVRLPVRQEFHGDLLGISHSIRHTQAIGSQVTKPAPVVTAAGGNQTGSREKTPSRENRSAGRRGLAIVSLVGGRGFRPQKTRLPVPPKPWPKVHAIAPCKRVCIRRTLFGT